MSPARTAWISAATAGAMVEIVAHFAAKHDLALLHQDILGRLAALRQAIMGAFTGHRAEAVIFGSDIATLKTDVATLKADVADLKSGMANLKADLTVLRTDFGSFRREALDEMGKLELRMTVKLG